MIGVLHANETKSEKSTAIFIETYLRQSTSFAFFFRKALQVLPPGRFFSFVLYVQRTFFANTRMKLFSLVLPSCTLRLALHGQVTLLNFNVYLCLVVCDHRTRLY